MVSVALDPEPKVNLAFRTAILVLLCFQNAGHALLTRYSQGLLIESIKFSVE